ncbi:MAG: hypothetical protein U1E15_07335 [Hyphomicrobiales bacterium]
MTTFPGTTLYFHLDTDEFANTPGAVDYLPKGAHSFTLAAGDRVISADSFAFHAGNPGAAYGIADTFSLTLNVNGMWTGVDTALLLENGRGTSANKIAVGAEGVVGAGSEAIRTLAKTDISNMGVISGGATAIHFIGGSASLNAKSTVTVTNLAGGLIEGATRGIVYEGEGALAVSNKGVIEGLSGSFGDEGSAGGIISLDGKVTLFNDLSATVTGTLRMGWLGSSVANKGAINGTIHAYMTEDAGTGIIDYDRDGTPAASDTGDRHWNAITETATTVTNTGSIKGYAAWSTDGNGDPVQVALDLSNGKDVVSNSGIVTGAVWTHDGNDSVSNALGARIIGDVNLGGSRYFAGYGIGAYALDADTPIAGRTITGVFCSRLCSSDGSPIRR